jgi:ppGpp synthetase/RelA/SpoT-type nucleotidyltranferase
MPIVEPHAVIDSFVAAYGERRAFFREVAELCHDQCRAALIGGAIRHFASYRAKSGERLKEKLYQRLEKRAEKGEDYPDAAAIEQDIVDFAGVRIALYFPGDAAAAVKILKEAFVLDGEGEKAFRPKTDRTAPIDDFEYRFGGYSATHLRVRLKRETVAHYEEAANYAKARIEIQVASVFMHAWAEVEHDLVYKPQEGPLSVAEYSLLDQVNGLAYAAEVALEQLQRTKAQTAKRQTAIPNHYDLAAYIHAHATHLTTANPVMGRADRLHTFLSRLGLNRPDKIDELLRKVPDKRDDTPLVERIVDVAIDADPNTRDGRRRIWNEILEASMAANPYTGEQSLAAHDEARLLISHWGTFNDTGRRLLVRLADRHTSTFLEREAIEKILGFDGDETGLILAARDAYSRLITSNWHGSDSELEQHAAALERGLRSLHTRFGHVLSKEGSER